MLCRQDRNFAAILSDANTELMTAYEVIRDHTQELIGCLARLQKEYDRASDQRQYYYYQRDLRPESKVESASRFIFLNKTCYNGLYRVNSKGEFNVPFGRYKNPKLFNGENLRAVSRALRRGRATLKSASYEEAVEGCEKGDVVYFDPPYQPVSKTSSFTSYTLNGFSEKDQIRLAKTFRKLAGKGCGVLLSNSNTSLVRKLYRGFNLEVVDANRAINSVGSSRRGFSELIVSNVELGIVHGDIDQARFV